MRLQDKTALITGGNSGIGLATARLFLAEGAQVAITGRNEATLNAAAQELGSDVLAVRADLLEKGSPEALVASVIARFGALDIVFANAGIPGTTPVGDTSREQFEAILATNVTSVFFTIQAALPHLTRGASIILNGSVHATLGIPGASAYAASKGAVRSMTRVLASELAERGIRVNIVVPGATKTPIWNNRAPTPEAFTALEETISSAIPLGHMGEAEDIARTVLFLASSDAANITAAEIVVDGGHTGAPSGAPIYRNRVRIA